MKGGTAAEAEAAGRLDAWLSDALNRVDQRTTELERREKAIIEREQKIQRAIAEASKV
jgi:hypothetical protein